MFTCCYQSMSLPADAEHSRTPWVEGGRKYNRILIQDVASAQTFKIMLGWIIQENERDVLKYDKDTEIFYIYLWCAWLADCQLDE